ncbi:element excision factor XisH family protein [Nostoc sp.]
MPAKDIYHDAVKNSLVQEGWIITDDPLHFHSFIRGTNWYTFNRK